MKKDHLKNKTILITGGTGSFGNAMTEYILTNHEPKAIRIFSRDEYKQSMMDRKYGDTRLRFFLGDIRDRDRIYRACEGVDIILNAAALKQVPICEYNPFEAIQTNIVGSMNVVNAAIDRGVQKVLNISSDKAVNPVNLYGATKLCSEKVFTHGNSYAGQGGTRLACVRYGNVVGSRGSVLPLFLEQRKENVLTITHDEMSRFWISLDQAVRFVVENLAFMTGGEIFVPKIPSMKVIDLAKAIAPKAKLKIIGIRPGEKLHETMIMQEEAAHTREYKGRYVILPEWFHTDVTRPYPEKPLPEDFVYASNLNDWWLNSDEMNAIVKEYEEKHHWINHQ